MMRTTNDVARRRRGRGGRAELQPPRAARLFSEVKFGPGGGVMPPRNRTMAATAVVMRNSRTRLGTDASRTRGVLGARASKAQNGNKPWDKNQSDCGSEGNFPSNLADYDSDGEERVK